MITRRQGVFGLYLFGSLLAVSFFWTPFAQWLDSAELTLAARTLGIAHPPGEPLYVMFSQPFLWLPLGTPSLRLLIASMVWLAFAIYGLRRFLPQQSGDTSVWVGLALFYPFVVQLLRPELYLLNFLLFVASYLLLFSRGPLDWRKWFVTAFLAGLMFANHTLLALFNLVIPGWWLGARALRSDRKGFLKKILFWGLFFILGASTYIFLPIRSMSASSFQFGTPHRWENFYWVVSGRLYSTYDTPTLERIYENFGAVVFLFAKSFGGILAALLLLGWVLGILRDAQTFRRDLLLFVLAIAAVLPNSALQVANPDLAGYLLPGFFLFFVNGVRGWQRFSAVAFQKNGFITGVLTLAAIFNFIQHRNFYDQTANPDTDRFQIAATLNLPWSSRIWCGSYHTYSTLKYGVDIERWRPDLQLRFLGLPQESETYESLLGGQSGSNPMGTTKDFFELAITAKADGYGVRLSENQLQKLIPTGWFYSVGEKADPAVMQQRIRNQQAFWLLPWWGKPVSVELKDHLLLTHFLAGEYYLSIGQKEAADWERQHSLMQRE